MPTDHFSTLVAAHQAMQLGCYFSAVDPYPLGNSQYLWSDIVPDPVWNFAVCHDLSTPVVDWILSSASSHGRTPAIFWPRAGLSGAPSLKGVAISEVPERWMTADLNQIDLPVRPAPVSRYEMLSSASPGASFERVFGQLFTSDSVNEHFRAVYVPALRKAVLSSDTEVVHLVAYHEDEPIGCASAYIWNGLAGLYNVGTIAPYQGKRIGSWASLQVLCHARSAGATEGFLQCEVATHVERMYTSIGFAAVATPVIGVLNNGERD
jgi:hypothetical protein